MKRVAKILTQNSTLGHSFIFHLEFFKKNYMYVKANISARLSRLSKQCGLMETQSDLQLTTVTVFTFIIVIDQSSHDQPDRLLQSDIIHFYRKFQEKSNIKYHCLINIILFKRTYSKSLQ